MGDKTNRAHDAWPTSSTAAMSSSARRTRWWSSCNALADDLNVGHLMLLMQFGNMGKELTQYNTKMFAEKVMPQLQDPLLRMGGPLVAEADGAGGARRAARLPAEAGGRITGAPAA